MAARGSTRIALTFSRRPSHTRFAARGGGTRRPIAARLRAHATRIAPLPGAQYDGVADAAKAGALPLVVLVKPFDARLAVLGLATPPDADPSSVTPGALFVTISEARGGVLFFSLPVPVFDAAFRNSPPSI